MDTSNDGNDLIPHDEAMNDERVDESEQQTQSTQQASQPTTSGALDAHLWGYLQPCSSALARIDFWKIKPKYTIGRNTESNNIVLPGMKISELNLPPSLSLGSSLTMA